MNENKPFELLIPNTNPNDEMKILFLTISSCLEFYLNFDGPLTLSFFLLHVRAIWTMEKIDEERSEVFDEDLKTKKITFFRNFVLLRIFVTLRFPFVI